MLDLKKRLKTPKITQLNKVHVLGQHYRSILILKGGAKIDEAKKAASLRKNINTDIEAEQKFTTLN
jgi:hypothetical protein